MVMICTLHLLFGRDFRAERNRQSAAASRERKKQHVKDLEERAKRLEEENGMLRYELDTEKRRREERERYFEGEMERLRSQLNMFENGGVILSTEKTLVGATDITGVATKSVTKSTTMEHDEMPRNS